MKTYSFTERGLAKLIGISRDAVGNALEKLISFHKIVVHPVPDENCSFFLPVSDYSLDEDPEAQERGREKVEEPVEEPDAKETPKPKLSRYEQFVQFCKVSRGLPEYAIPQLYEYENKLGHRRFNEILDSSFEEHERKKKVDPVKYYGTCHALLLHRLRKEVGG